MCPVNVLGFWRYCNPLLRYQGIIIIVIGEGYHYFLRLRDYLVFAPTVLHVLLACIVISESTSFLLNTCIPGGFASQRQSWITQYTGSNFRCFSQYYLCTVYLFSFIFAHYQTSYPAIYLDNSKYILHPYERKHYTSSDDTCENCFGKPRSYLPCCSRGSLCSFHASSFAISFATTSSTSFASMYCLLIITFTVLS